MKMNSTKGGARARLLTSTLLAGLATVAAPLALTAVATAIPTLASAQDYTSGTLVGTVTDTSGAPVANATVAVKSLRQGFERNVTTDSDGQFRVSLIPTGGYSVTINKSGFQPLTDGNVAVRLGSQSNYGFNLLAEGEVEAVVVTGAANPQLDFAQTTTGAVLDVETLVKNVPVVRNVTALTLLAPSAIEGTAAFSAQGLGQASIGGSSVGENVFYVNGLNITNFINGIGGALVPFDFYKTIEVKTGGYAAEYGRGTGGVINAVTKSGSNDFTFAVHGNWEPKSMRAHAPDTFQTVNSRVGQEYKDVVLEAGGPIIKDHLFFYGIYQQPDTEQTTAAKIGNYYGVRKWDDPVWGVKLDGYLTSRQHLEFTYFDTTFTRTQQRYKYNGVTDTIGAASSKVIDNFGGPSYVGRYTGTFTDWLTVSAAYGKTKFSNDLINDPFDQPNVVDLRSGTAQTISNQTVAASTTPSEATREFYRGDIDIYFKLFGSHHVRAGLDNEKTKFVNFGVRNGGQNWTIRKNTTSSVNSQGFAPGQEYFDLRTFAGGGSFEGENKAYYIQDAWDITDRLTVNLGFRRDNFLEQDSAGQAFSNFEDLDAMRLGFNWDPTGDRQNRIYGSYGRYYLPVAANTAYRAASNNLDVRQYFLPAGGGLYIGTPAATNPLTTPSTGGLTAGTGLPTAGLGPVVTRGTNPTFTNLAACTQLFLDRGIVNVPVGTQACAVGSAGVAPPPESISALNVKATAEDEYILGYEHRFNSLWKANVNLTYRTLLRAADDAAIDSAVLAYCDAHGYARFTAAGDGCEETWSGLNQYLIVNPGEDMKAVLYAPLPGETDLRTIDLSAAALGLPKVKREYTSLEFSFERSFDGKWGLQGSYVLSESKGNFEGAVKSDTGQADAGITSDFDTPGFIPGTYGLLPNHHAHQFKLFGSYAVTDNFLIGGNASLISPRHYGCQGLVPSTYPNASASNTYAPLPGHFCNGQLVPRGSSFKGDWINKVDLSIRYTVPEKILPAGNLVLRADIFNLFNSQGAQELYEQGDLSSGGADPHFGEPGSSSGTVGSGYQTPRYVRFGFDLAF